IQLARADAGLGNVNGGLRRLEALLRQFEGCDHPLVHGRLHETRARIAWKAGRVPEYEHSLAAAERAYRPTGTPALIASLEALARLGASARRSDYPPATESNRSPDATTILDG